MNELLLTQDMEVEAVFGIQSALERRREARPHFSAAARKGAATRFSKRMKELKR